MYGGPGLRVLDNEGFTSLFAPEPGITGAFLSYCLEKPDIDFTPDYTSSRTYSLTYVDLTDLNVNFIVEGSYPGHCEEPAIVRVTEVDDDGFFAWEGSATVIIEAIDRQDDIGAVVAGCPALFADIKELTAIGENLFSIEFTNENYASPGTYPVIITTWSLHDPENLTIGQTAFVNLHPYPAASSYYGDGHPMEGVNCRRNNRSVSLLPLQLSGDDAISPFDEDYSYSDLVIGDDGRMYVGAYMNVSTGGYVGSMSSGYKLRSFYFGDDTGPSKSGGMLSVLTLKGIYSISKGSSGSWSNLPGPGMVTFSRNYYFSFCRYGAWPDLIADIFESYSYYHEHIKFTEHYIDDYSGDLEARDFNDQLPIPGDNVVTSCRRRGHDLNYLQLLSVELEDLNEHGFVDAIFGYALDGTAAKMYVATGSGLYGYSPDLVEIWNTAASMPVFSTTMPVIADDGGIIGCSDGFIRRVEPDGSPGPEFECGALQRPCILNDGTVAVICESTIKYFNEQLNMVDEIPLPSGEDSGSEYTRPPLVDANDNMALFAGDVLYIINKNGDVIAQRTFNSDVREIRLGPEHLFVALDYEIYRFPS